MQDLDGCLCHCTGYHGGDGPLYLSDAVETLELKHAFIRASQELGMKPVDPNGKESLGNAE